MSITRAGVDGWLAAYVEAWRTSDRAKIAALFSLDVEYRYKPWQQPIVGRDEVVAMWLGQRDHPDASSPDTPTHFIAQYRTIAVDGAVAVATGSTAFARAAGGPIVRVFDNCFIMRFDGEGRCRAFAEWFTQRPAL